MLRALSIDAYYQYHSREENDAYLSEVGKKQVNDEDSDGDDDLGWILYPTIPGALHRCSVQSSSSDSTVLIADAIRCIRGIVPSRSPLFTKLSTDLEIQRDPVINAFLAVTFL